MANEIQVFDICSIERSTPHKDLLIERFGTYLNKHYKNLHRPHRHSFYHLVLFTSGIGWHTIDFQKFKVNDGQIYFMIPGQVHSWHFEKEVDGFIVHFNEGLFSSFLQGANYFENFSFFSGDAAIGVRQLLPSLFEKVVNIFEELLDGKGEVTGLGLDRTRVLLLQLFILIEQLCPTSQRLKKPPHKLLIFRNFQKLIDQHYQTLRLPKEYAELLYITPNHLNALCQELVGRSSGELIRDRIILEAKRLLTNSAFSAAQIGSELNFQDSSYFTRFFRKHVGITPETFRNMFDQQEPFLYMCKDENNKLPPAQIKVEHN
jgi:AraC-like DNA-binding protein